MGCYKQKFEPVPLLSTQALYQTLVEYFNLPEQLWPLGFRMAYLPVRFVKEREEELRRKVQAALPAAEAVAQQISEVRTESERQALNVH